MTKKIKTPHLAGAEKYLRPHPGQRLCFHLAAAFVLDVPGAEFVVGTLRAATPEEAAQIAHASTRPFIHAWAEWQGEVWSPTAKARCARERYYAVNDVKDVKRLTRPQLLAVARRIGLSQHLRLGQPTKGNASVGVTLLEAAGKPYIIVNHAMLPGDVP